MSLDSTRRFTRRADYYAKFRPTYPPEAIRLLREETGLKASDVIADLGSGTGLLSRLFLENGNLVFAVEPNGSMRRHAEKALAGFPRFVSVAGTAERTTLPRRSIDLIAVGQALHWFEPKRAVKEFSRISKPSASLCVLYNERKEEGEFMLAYEELVRRNERDRAKVPNVDGEYARRFFRGERYSTFTIPNSQVLDLDGLLGRLLSASYIPAPNEKSRYAKLRKDVRRTFDTYNSGGCVTIVYDTTIFIGKVKQWT